MSIGLGEKTFVRAILILIAMLVTTPAFATSWCDLSFNDALAIGMRRKDSALLVRASKMYKVCAATEKLFAVTDVAYGFAAELLYVSVQGDQNKDELNYLAENICKTRSISDENMFIHITSPLEWDKLRSTLQLTRLHTTHLLKCEAGQPMVIISWSSIRKQPLLKSDTLQRKPAITAYSSPAHEVAGSLH